MMLKLMKVVAFNVTSIIESILASALLVFGLYVATPALLDSLRPHTLELVTAGGGPWRWVIFAAYIITASITLIGVTWGKLEFRAWGTFGMMLVFLFLTLFKLFDHGPASFVLWVTTGAAALISAVLHFGVKVEQWNQRSSP